MGRSGLCDGETREERGTSHAILPAQNPPRSGARVAAATGRRYSAELNRSTTKGAHKMETTPEETAPDQTETTPAEAVAGSELSEQDLADREEYNAAAAAEHAQETDPVAEVDPDAEAAADPNELTEQDLADRAAYNAAAAAEHGEAAPADEAADEAAEE